MRSLLLLVTTVGLNMGLAACAHAQATLIDGSTQQNQTLAQAVSAVQPGSIVIVGENHDLKSHQQEELQVMQALRDRGLTVAVGMEFFSYIYQAQVNAYRAGTLAEADFLKQIQWGSDPFPLYRDQALFAKASEGASTIALNAPMSLTGDIAKVGMSGLSAAEQALLPPNFTLGRDSYKQRFLDLMGGSGHLPSPQAADNYFAAQSTWDDTMAWRATEYLRQHPDQVVVIVVGEFHIQYGGGLPDRLKARLPGLSVWTISLVNTSGLTADEQQQELLPSPVYGPRANFIWYGPAD